MPNSYNFCNPSTHGHSWLAKLQRLDKNVYIAIRGSIFVTLPEARRRHTIKVSHLYRVKEANDGSQESPENGQEDV